MFDEVLHLEVVESTHAMLQQMTERGELVCGRVLSADFQTGGRGQGSNSWHSKYGQNILMSLCWCPAALSASRQFGISVAVSMAVVKMLKQHKIPEVRIKWPNDIWSGDRKLAGLLVSNTISGNMIAQSIVSLGLNVNEPEFPAELPNPVSMRMLSGLEYDCMMLMRSLLELIREHLGLLDRGNIDALEEEFRLNLLGLGQKRVFSVAGIITTCMIEGVDEYGRLRLMHHDGTISAYDMSEIKMLQ